MGRYPKYKLVREDLLKSFTLWPLGAFVKDGAVISGWKGVEQSVPPISGLTAMCAFGNAVIAGTDGGDIYTGSNSGTELTLRYSYGESCSAFTFETYDTAPRAVLLCGNTFTAVSQSNLIHGQFPVRLRCGTVRRGRLFGADADFPYMLRWSAVGYNDWTEGITGAGRLVLEPLGGHILNIFDFEDELVVFREQSVMRFSTFGNPENFKETDTVRTPVIYNRTAVISGDSILFFSSSGLMRYRGGKVTPIDGLISRDLSSPTSAFAYEGRYYFICGTSKSMERPVVYVYDFLYDSYEIIDIPAYFVCCDGASPLAYAPSAVYRLQLASESTLYRVSTKKLDFGTDRRKLLTELEVDCDEDVLVSIYNGKNTETYRSANGRTRLNLRGAEFRVTFSGYGGSVRSAYLTAEVT